MELLSFFIKNQETEELSHSFEVEDVSCLSQEIGVLETFLYPCGRIAKLSSFSLMNRGAPLFLVKNGEELACISIKDLTCAARPVLFSTQNGRSMQG